MDNYVVLTLKRTKTEDMKTIGGIKTVENEFSIRQNQILGSAYETEINDLRFSGMELKDICDFMWTKRNYKVSPATLSRYFQTKKQLGKTAAKDVQTHLKNVYKEEYMDLVGRVAFFNSVILEAKKRFEREKQNLNLMDLLNLATKMGDSLQKIEGADAQNDLLRNFASLIMEIKTEPRAQRLPIVEVAPDGTVTELECNEPPTDEQEELTEAQIDDPPVSA